MNKSKAPQILIVIKTFPAAGLSGKFPSLTSRTDRDNLIGVLKRLEFVLAGKKKKIPNTSSLTGSNLK